MKVQEHPLHLLVEVYVTEVAVTESPRLKEESSIIFGKPKLGRNPWGFCQNLETFYWQSFHECENCQSDLSKKSKEYFLDRFAKSTPGELMGKGF